MLIEEEEEEGITTSIDEEQLPKQHDQITESPIGQEDQQVTEEQPQEEIFPGIDNNIPHAQEEEEKKVEGTIEHITQEHIPSTEKPEQSTLSEEKIETTTVEKESIPSHEHVTETPVEIPSEEAVEVSSEVKLEAPTTIQGTEESLVTEAPASETPESSSVANRLPEGEIEHISTEENIIEKEHVTEEGQSIEPSISEITEGPKEEETTSPHEESSTQTQEEVTKIEKTTEEQSVTKMSERPEISTEIIEKTTSPTEEPSISTVSESVSEQPKEGKPETTPGEFLATQTELPKEEEIVTLVHEISTTEQIITEKEEISYPTETAVTEQSTEVSSSKEQPTEEEKPVTVSEGEKEQQPEETTSQHTIEKQATVGAKKEDAGLTESPVVSEESVTTEKSYVEEESTPEIPVQGPTGIPIPERSPEQKAEDESVYHVTEDYHGVTHPEISPDNLITESSQKTPTTQEQETTLVPSEETTKSITMKGTEVLIEETTKPILEQSTEINLSTQSEFEITTVSEKKKIESIPTVIEVEASTESSATTIAQEIPEEAGTKIPQTEIQLTEKTPSGEKDEKEVQPKKEEEIETQPPIVTESAPETPISSPAEHSTIPSDLGEEHATKGEHVTVIPSEQSTHVPTQIEEKETEIVPVEKEESVTEKPVEERVTEHPITTPGIIDEKEKELQTEEPVLIEEQTTEAIKTIEAEEKLTTRIPVEEGITEQPEQYSTEKALEETVTKTHGPEEIEYTKGVSTESAEQQTAITEKEPSEETVELKPTEVTRIEQTELPAEHPTEAGEIEKEGEEKISVPVSTEEVQTTIVETGATETTTVQTEKIPSIGGEHIPSQPPIPSDRKEDQGPIEEPEPEEQITQKPEKEITETYEESQKPTVHSEEEIHIPPLEGVVTESILPEEKPTESSITESAGVGETVASEQPEISSMQPEKVATEPSGQEEQTQEPITEEQPELHDRKEIETSSPITHEESSIIPEIPERPVEDQYISTVTETAENGSTISILIPEASTELPGFEEPTKHEIPIEKEIIPATESSEKEQPEIQEQTTQPSIKEETSSKEKDEAEISTEKDIIPTTETPEVSITEKQPEKSEEEEIIKKIGITDMPDHEEKGEYSTIAPKETSEIVTTEILPKDVSQYTTNIPEETSVEGESTTEIAPRPSGIPGEGNCLVEGQSYNNNSAVPPANACRTSCRCISSIVQCELVQCPPPPAHLSNCMPVHGDSCCPIYACDSTPDTELKSDSHVIEPHIPGKEEESQKTVPPEISTEGATESITLASEISTPESQPIEITVTPAEEEIAIERQQTTLKPIETVYEQPTTVRKPIEKYPEEHTIIPVFETSQETTSQIPEEEHTMLGETTEGKVNEEGITESITSTEQPQEEIGEKEITVSGQIITSTHVPIEQEPQGTEEIVPITQEKETSVPVEIEEVSIPVEKEEVTTAAGKDEEIIPPVKEQEKPIEEKGIEEQSTFKPIEEIEKEQPEEEKVPLKPTSEESIITEEHETSTKPEEIITKKSEIPEEPKTVKPPEYETSSVPEIQTTTEYKFEGETGSKEEKEQETITELTETAQTEEPENQTKLPGIAPSEIETQKPIISAVESTTLIHDHTISKGTPIEEYTTIKSVEISTEGSTKIEPEISTQVPTIEKEHVTIPVLPVETELPSEETTKLIEESTPEVSHEEILPETTESVIEKETTEHAEKHTEPSITEHEEEPSATKSPEEKPSEIESPVSTEEPSKTTESVTVTEKATETSIAHEPESTQISVEKHSEATPEIESHTSELPIEGHTTAQEILTTSGEEVGEQATTSKEIEPSLSEVSTKQPVIPESETPVIEEEHVTSPVEEQTPKSEESPVEEQTVVFPSSSEEKITEEGVSTEVPVTTQEEQTTEKIIEDVKPETQLPDLTEERTIIPEISKKDEEQKPEIGITEEPSKEESTTIPELTEEGKKEMEEAVTPAGTTEYEELVVRIQKPMETTIVPKEPEKDSQVTEASLPEHPVSEEVTTVASLTPEEHPISEEVTTVASLIPEEHPVTPIKTEEEQSTHEPEYQTTLFTAEDVSKLMTETNEVEKLSPEEETITTESTEKLEESVTKLGATEKPEEVPSETEKSTVLEQETELPEQGETTTKIIESTVTKETLPEEVVPVEVIPKVEEKPTEVSTTEKEEEEEEAHYTEPTYSETTSVREEEQPPTTKLQPTERPLSPEEEKTPPGEIQPSQPEEGGEAHPTIPEESHPSITEEPQFTTEHAPEEPITIKPEEEPEISSEAIEGPIKISPEKPTELPEEIATIAPIVPEESESQIPIKPEESPQPETPIEEPIIKTQPLSTELPIGEITEEIPEEEPIHPQEGEGHPQIDHFPQATLKPEIDYNFHEQQPATTLAPHIPEYPDQTGISGEDTHFPMPGGSYPNPDDDYGEDDYGGPGTCRYGGKVYVSAQQIPRDDPCDFCFCFRSDIICLQQSCPPPIPGCHEEPISGFCCPRYECPVSMATALNLTTTTTTTTTTLPPHFHPHAYKGAARRSGCQVRGQAYRVGEVIKSASGPCLRCM